MGELGLLRSGEMLLRLPLLLAAVAVVVLVGKLSGERLCLTFTRPHSTALPAPGGVVTAAAARANGGVQLVGGGLPPLPLPPPPPRVPPGPVLLPTEAEAAGERVGLCWLPLRSWKGTVARIGWSNRLVPEPPPGAPRPTPPLLLLLLVTVPLPLPPPPPAPLLPTEAPAPLPPPLPVGDPAAPRRIL